MPAGRQLDREGLGFFDRHESAGAGGGKEPDRLPVDFMGTASCMVDAAYYALRDRMGLRGDARMFRRGENTRFYDDRILEALGVDFRRVWLREPPGWGPRVAEDGTIEDGCGLRRRRIGDLLSYVNAPLEKATVDDLARYPWPDPNDPGRVEGLAEKARQLHEDGRYAIVARAPTLGMFDLAQRLRGMQQFLMDLLTDKPFALALIHKPKEMQMGFYEVLLNAVGPYVDIVETGDDYGAQNGPLISPSAFREMISPARRELNEWIKSKAPGVKIFLHSDGAIFKLIPCSSRSELISSTQWSRRFRATPRRL
jgi:uroporphyrinogen decarboxylase